jgi:hypothetical protein
MDHERILFVGGIIQHEVLCALEDMKYCIVTHCVCLKEDQKP